MTHSNSLRFDGTRGVALDVRNDGVAVVTVEPDDTDDRTFSSGLVQACGAISDAEVDVVVLTGSPAAFESERYRTDDERRIESRSLARANELVLTLEQLNVPVVGAFQGDVLGFGLGVALGTDVRIGARDSNYRVPDVPETASTDEAVVERLIGELGVARGQELLATTEQFDATTMAEWGLLNEVLPAADVFDRALTIANEISSHPRVLVQYVTRAIDSASPVSPRGTSVSATVSDERTDSGEVSGPVTADFETVRVSEPRSDIDLITIDRRPRLNALNRQVLTDLERSIDYVIDHDPDAVVLEGAGERAFSIGLDERERNVERSDPNVIQELVRDGQLVIEKLASLPMPVVAAVSGFAMGGGLELALGADIRIGGASSTYSFPELTHELIPAAGATQRLPAAVGRARAKEMILLGEEYSSSTMADWGVLSSVVETDVTDEALGIAQRLGSGGESASSLLADSQQANDWPTIEGFVLERVGFSHAFLRGSSEM